MKVQLSSGEANVRVFYPYHPDGRRRDTVIWVRLASGSDFAGRASCSPADQFCRLTGRKLALRRMLGESNGRDPLTGREMGALYQTIHRFPLRADRRALWQAVCPDLVRQPKNGDNSTLKKVENFWMQSREAHSRLERTLKKERQK